MIKRGITILILIFMCLSTTSCVMFFGNWGALGLGERIVEYNDDGSIKKETTKSKSLLDSVFNFAIGKQE